MAGEGVEKKEGVPGESIRYSPPKDVWVSLGLSSIRCGKEGGPKVGGDSLLGSLGVGDLRSRV